MLARSGLAKKGYGGTGSPMSNLRRSFELSNSKIYRRDRRNHRYRLLKRINMPQDFRLNPTILLQTERHDNKRRLENRDDTPQFRARFQVSKHETNAMLISVVCQSRKEGIL